MMAYDYYTLDNIGELRNAVLESEDELKFLRKERKEAQNKFDKTSQDYNYRGRPELQDYLKTDKSELAVAIVAFNKEERELTHLESKLDALERVPEGPIH
jgi:hypothetical protein